MQQHGLQFYFELVVIILIFSPHHQVSTIFFGLTLGVYPPISTKTSWPIPMLTAECLPWIVPVGEVSILLKSPCASYPMT